MRRKVVLAAMAVPNDHHVRVLESIADLEVRGREAAFSLFTINHFTSLQEVAVTDIVNCLFCVVGAVPALRNLLLVTPDAPLLSRRQVDILSERIASCHSILRKIAVCVREADDWLGPVTSTDPAEAPPSFYPYPQGELRDARETVGACFRDMVVAITTARAEHLSRFGFLTDDEVYECRRLRVALKHPEYSKQPELALSPPAPPPPPALAPEPVPIKVSDNSPIPSTAQRDVLELAHPRGFRGRYGLPDYPLPHKQLYVQLSPPDPALRFDTSFEEDELRRQQLRSEGRYPDIAAFGVWPPTSIEPNSVQDRQLRPVMADKGKGPATPIASSADSSAGMATNAPDPVPTNAPRTADSESQTSSKEGIVDSSLENTTDTTSIPATEETASGAEPDQSATEARKDPETFTPESVQAKPVTKPVATTTSPPHVCSGSNQPTSPANTATNLEAYILRPVWEDVYHAIEWSYKIEQLPLENAEIQAHMETLEPNYSIINSISELLPEQLRVIRIRVKARHGHLQSLQYGREVDMFTKMGTFQLKSVIFILKTSLSPQSEVEDGNKTFENQGNAFQPPAGSADQGFSRNLFGGANQAHGNSLFGNPNQNNNRGLFGNHNQNNSRGLFGNRYQNNNRGLFSNRDQTTSVVNPPGPPQSAIHLEEYVKNLENQGEVCLYLEKDSTTNVVQHYQSMPFNLPYRGLSFEELRLADLKAGRTGLSSKPSTPFGVNNASSTTLGGGGLFGSRPTTYKALVEQSSNSHTRGDIGNARHASSGGLFGGATPHASTASTSSATTPNNYTPTVPSIFGGLSAQATASRFGPGSWLSDRPGTQSTTIPSEGGVFSVPGQSTTASSGGPLFGVPAQSTTAPSRGGLFGTLGQSTTAPSGGGLFGGVRTQSTTAPSGDRLFGVPAQSTTTPSRGGLFGTLGQSTTAPSAGGLFGGVRTQTAATPSAGPLFGGPLYGTASPSGGGLFGGVRTQSTAAPPSSGLLGMPTIRGPLPSTGLVGGFGMQSYTPPSTNLFGIPPVSQPSSGLFGSAPPINIAPVQPSLFGYAAAQHTNTTPPSLFPESQSAAWPGVGANFSTNLASQYMGTAQNGTAQNSSSLFGHPEPFSSATARLHISTQENPQPPATTSIPPVSVVGPSSSTAAQPDTARAAQNSAASGEVKSDGSEGGVSL